MRCLAVTLLVIIAATGLPGQTEERRPRRRLGFLPAEARQSWRFRRQVGEAWALTGVRLVDLEGARIGETVHVVVKGDVIRSVEPGPPPEGMKVVDGGGGYLIPGLFDLHAHVVSFPGFMGSKGPEETMRRLLDAGVTTIRLLPLLSEGV